MWIKSDNGVLCTTCFSIAVEWLFLFFCSWQMGARERKREGERYSTQSGFELCSNCIIITIIIVFITRQLPNAPPSLQRFNCISCVIDKASIHNIYQNTNTVTRTNFHIWLAHIDRKTICITRSPFNESIQVFQNYHLVLHACEK